MNAGSDTMDHDDRARLRPDPRRIPVAAAGAAPAAAMADATVDWVDVCAVEDIPAQGARVLRRAGRTDVAIFRTVHGTVFALLDRCPHKGGPLSQGIVHGERVACPLHNWSIGLADGEAAAPDVGCTTPFTVRVEAGRVRMDAAQLRSVG
jgi:nitrite reductase (NADH) small subunit